MTGSYFHLNNTIDTTSWSSLDNLHKPSYKTNLYDKNPIVVSAINAWNN